MKRTLEGKVVIDDRAISEIKGFAKRQWDDYHKPPEQISLILMGLAVYLKANGLEVPFEVEVKGDPRDPYRC